MQCACCGETEVEFLGIDHIDGDGAQHRREVLPSRIYRWLIKNKFPAGIQVSVHNCNLAKGYYGACPHQDTNGSYPVSEGMQTPSDDDGLGPPASVTTVLGKHPALMAGPRTTAAISQPSRCRGSGRRRAVVLGPPPCPPRSAVLLRKRQSRPGGRRRSAPTHHAAHSLRCSGYRIPVRPYPSCLCRPIQTTPTQ